MLKDISGSTVARALASSLHRPGVWTLPQTYVKAGATLLDIIQAKPSRLPMSSQELFSILDNASEKTFLCAGTAESVQKYVFDGETAKNSLELKNLVALTSFLFEQLLVKAWVAEKAAEALRFHKLLVDEEEAAQKRQAVLLERKKQKKIRQKEQKVREQYYGCNGDLNVYVDAVDRPTSAEASGFSSPSYSNSNSEDIPSILDSVETQNKVSDEDIEAPFDVSSELKKQGDSPVVEPQMVGANGHRHVATNCLQAPKSQRGSRYGLHANLNLQASKHELTHNFGPSKDRSQHSGNKGWTKKLKSNNDGENMRPPSQEVTGHQIEQYNDEVIIGSIPITVKSYIDQQQGSHPNETQNTFSTDHTALKKKNVSEKLVKSNSFKSGTNRVASKYWRPVSRDETKNLPPVGRSNEDHDDDAILVEAPFRTRNNGRSGQSRSLDNEGCHNGKQFYSLSNDNSQQEFVPFSSKAAKEFLARRWKEAITGDHVKLVLSSGHEPSGHSDIQHSPGLPGSNAPNHADTQFGRTIQVHVTKKSEKSVKFKYIPKES